LKLSQQTNKKLPLIFIVGPTAVGKTALSLDIAQRFNGEIISGDSMQVYRGMDIGTAKASAEEQALIPHHLIDIREPNEPFTVSEFQQIATNVIADIHSRGKLPIVVGGTGLYVESLCYHFQFGEGAPDLAFRDQLTERAEQEGNEVLYKELTDIDPEAAAKIHVNDIRRIIRALEVWHTKGVKMSESSNRKESIYDALWIGLTMDRAKLYSRIEQRIDMMLHQGLIEEVKQLKEKGLEQNNVALQALGYKEIIYWLNGEIDYDRAVELLKRDTRHFAKRQLSWFRRMPEINWFDCTDGNKNAEHFLEISDIINGKFIERAT
jgi:tRNA dimethylallyltransferase